MRLMTNNKQTIEENTAKTSNDKEENKPKEAAPISPPELQQVDRLPNNKGQVNASSKPTNADSEEAKKIQTLLAMGFPEKLAYESLSLCNGSVEQAITLATLTLEMREQYDKSEKARQKNDTKSGSSPSDDNKDANKDEKQDKKAENANDDVDNKEEFLDDNKNEDPSAVNKSMTPSDYLLKIGGGNIRDRAASALYTGNNDKKQQSSTKVTSNNNDKDSNNDNDKKSKPSTSQDDVNAKSIDLNVSSKNIDKRKSANAISDIGNKFDFGNNISVAFAKAVEERKKWN